MMIQVSELITAVGILVALTNIFTEVLKKVTADRVPTNVVALIISELLTVAGGIAYVQIHAIAMHWYTIAGLIVGGWLVAYAAMFGFDKLVEIMHWRDGK